MKVFNSYSHIDRRMLTMQTFSLSYHPFLTGIWDQSAYCIFLKYPYGKRMNTFGFGCVYVHDNHLSGGKFSSLFCAAMSRITCDGNLFSLEDPIWLVSWEVRM